MPTIPQRRRAAFLEHYRSRVAAGASDATIAAELAITPAALYHRLRRAGETTRPDRADRIAAARTQARLRREAAFLAAYDRARDTRPDADAPAVADELGLTVAALNKRLERAGRPGFYIGSGL